ncbi:MAG: ABC transporter ATP-binding protein [Ktedonobacteraceae bacterium]
MRVQMKRYWRLLVKYLRPQWLSVVLLTVLLLASIALQLLNPQVIRYFIDTTQAGGQGQTLLFAALLFIAIALIQRTIAFCATYVAENVGWTATNALRADLALHCLLLDMSFHKKYTPGELIERIDGDVNSLANFFSQFTLQVLGNSLLIAGILLLLFREDWRIGVGLAVYSIISLLALALLQRIAVSKWAIERQADAEHYGFLEEHIAGTEDIRAIGAEAYVTHRLYRLMRRMLETYRVARLLSNLTYISTRFLFVIGYTIGLGLAVYLYSQHQATIGTAYLIVYYIGTLSTPLENIQEQVADLQEATASIERVEELLQLRPQVQEQAQATLSAGTISAEFQDVSFSYEPQQVVLRNVSFHLPVGKVLGILGRTGSGKTTLARLLFRLYDPTSGTISLNGVNIRDVALDHLRDHVGMVTQDVQLFQASVRDNLTLFKQGVSDKQIERVLMELGLWEWIQSLPDGLDTELATGGQGLSAGEAQLLAFARVFLKNPALVILDEASSRLDPATENLLEWAVDRLLEQRTGIMIAHRLKTVLRADDIMVLEDGCIVEYGPRVALMHDPTSRFYSLLQTGLEEVLV